MDNHDLYLAHLRDASRQLLDAIDSNDRVEIEGMIKYIERTIFLIRSNEDRVVLK
jgi:hypothetical protein